MRVNCIGRELRYLPGMAELHLIKLSVGTESVADLARWQKSARAKGPDGLPRHVTRMWPKREGELLADGSISCAAASFWTPR